MSGLLVWECMNLAFLALLALCVVGHLWMISGHGDKKGGEDEHKHH